MINLELENKAIIPPRKLHKVYELLVDRYQASQTITNEYQINTYFSAAEGVVLLDNLDELFNQLIKSESLGKRISKSSLPVLSDIPKDMKVSVRTRSTLNDNKNYIFIKFSKSDPVNGKTRIEYVIPLTGDVKNTDNVLEQIFKDSGFLVIDSKWRRVRQEFKVMENDGVSFTVSLDRNAGYGDILEVEYLPKPEFAQELNALAQVTLNPEIVIESLVEVIQYRVDSLIWNLGLEPLRPEILEKMYQEYRNNWIKYYLSGNLVYPQIGVDLSII